MRRIDTGGMPQDASGGAEDATDLIGEADIVTGYRWFLGRPPSAVEIEGNLRHYAALDGDCLPDFQRALSTSAEFRARRLALHKITHARPADLDRPRLAFLHVEKCGGTTLHAMLSSQFAPDRICPERHEGLGDWTINELAAFELFSGHFDLSLCRSIPGRVRIVTMLREPKARLLSLYHFWRAHRPHPDRDFYNLLLLARACTPLEFFAHPVVTGHLNIRNAVAGQLIRTRSAMLLEPDDPILADPAGALEQAWMALEGLAAFGILERFEMSRRLLNRTLGLDMPAIEPRQVLADLVRTGGDFLPVERAPPDERLDALLTPLTEIDSALYRRAVALFERRVAAAGLEVAGPGSRCPLLRHLGATVRRIGHGAGPGIGPWRTGGMERGRPDPLPRSPAHGVGGGR